MQRRIKGLVVGFSAAATLAAGCATSPEAHTAEPTPAPMPTDSQGCSWLMPPERTHHYSEVGAVYRNTSECVSLYQPDTNTMIGSIATGEEFFALCSNALARPSHWIIMTIPDDVTGKVHLSPDMWMATVQGAYQNVPDCPAPATTAPTS